MNIYDFTGWALVATGILYVAKPNLYRSIPFLTTRSVAMRKLSPSGYVRYMRILGTVQIVLGLSLLAVTHSIHYLAAPL